MRFREKGAPKECAKPLARRARRVEAWRRCELGGGGVLPLIRFRRPARAGRWRGRRRHGRWMCLSTADGWSRAAGQGCGREGGGGDGVA